MAAAKPAAKFNHSNAIVAAAPSVNGPALPPSCAPRQAGRPAHHGVRHVSRYSPGRPQAQFTVRRGGPDALCGSCHPGQTAMAASGHDPCAEKSRGPMSQKRRRACVWGVIARTVTMQHVTCGRRHRLSGPPVRTRFAWRVMRPTPGPAAASKSHRGPRCTRSRCRRPARWVQRRRHCRSGLMPRSWHGPCHVQDLPRPPRTAAPRGLAAHGRRPAGGGPVPHVPSRAAVHRKHHAQPGDAAPGGFGSARGALCHAPHAAAGGTSKFLWSAPLGTAGNTADVFCLGCHGDRGEGTRLAFTQHPATARKKPAAGTQPVPTTQAARVESIVCATCHLPHGRDIAPLPISPGDKTAARQAAVRPMLRANVDRTVCAACHGGDAPVLFLYYHQPAKRSDVRTLTEP